MPRELAKPNPETPLLLARKSPAQAGLLFSEGTEISITSDLCNICHAIYRPVQITLGMLITGKLAASNFIRKRNMLLNLKENCYNIQEKLFSLIPFSEGCKKLPKVDYVLLFRSLYIKCEGCEPADFEDTDISFVQLSLVYNKNRRLIVHETKNTAEAFELAQQLALHFNVKVRDAATNRRNPVWLKKVAA